MTELVKYGKWTDEDAEKEAEELTQRTSGDFLKLQPGRNVLRFMPPKLSWKKQRIFEVTSQHYVPPSTPQGKATSFNCPRHMLKKACPVCQKVDDLMATGNPKDRDNAFRIAQKLRVYANVIDRKAPDAGPRIIAMGKTLYEPILALKRDKDAGGDFEDPLKGFDIIVTREGTGMTDTKYTVRPARDTTPLGNLEWIEMQKDLSRYGAVPTTEEILHLLGIEPEDDDPPPRRQALPRQVDVQAAPSGRSRRTAMDDAVDADIEE